MQRKSIYVGLLCLALTACVRIGAGGSSVQEENFTLEPDLSAIPHKVSSAKTIQVNMGQAVVALRSRKMAYQEQAGTLDYFATHQWLAPPVSLITPALGRALTESGHYKAVILAPSYGGIADYQVSVQLYQLQQNFSGSHSEEVVCLEVVVVDSTQNKAIGAHTFSMHIPAASNPSAGALAANKALSELMPQIVQFVLTQTH